MSDDSDTLATVEAGDKLSIPASDWNALVRMARDYYRSSRISGEDLPADREDETTVLVQNNSGSDVGQFGILKVTAPLVLASASRATYSERHAFTGTIPDATSVFVVTQAPISNGAIGPAIIMGETAAKVNVTDSSHKFAVPSASLSAFDSATSGPAEIVWYDVSGGSTGSNLDARLLIQFPSVAGGIIVKEVDGTPTVSGVGTEQFDSTTGLSVTDNGGGNVTVKGIAATETQWGVVTTATQFFAGKKSFKDTIYLNSGGSHGASLSGGDWSLFCYDGVGQPVMQIQNGDIAHPGSIQPNVFFFGGTANALRSATAGGYVVAGAISSTTIDLRTYTLGTPYPEASLTASNNGVGANTRFSVDISDDGSAINYSMRFGENDVPTGSRCLTISQGMKFAIRTASAGVFDVGQSTTQAGLVFTGGILTSGSFSGLSGTIDGGTW